MHTYPFLSLHWKNKHIYISKLYFTSEGFEQFKKQIHESLEYLLVENLSQRRKRQEKERVCFEKYANVFLDKEKIQDTYKQSILIGRSKCKKGNLKGTKGNLKGKSYLIITN